MNYNYHLYVPEHWREQVIFSLINMTEAASALGLKGKVFNVCRKVIGKFHTSYMYNAWEKCLRKTEVKNFTYVGDFLTKLQIIAYRRFGINRVNENAFYYLRIALIESFFIRFSQENIFTVTMLLEHAVDHQTFVDSSCLREYPILQKIRDCWVGYLRLISLGKIYPKSIEFFEIFFSPNLFQSRVLAVDFFSSRDIIAYICQFLSGEDLHSLRQCYSRSYNAIEENNVLRTRHRIYLLERPKIKVCVECAA